MTKATAVHFAFRCHPQPVHAFKNISPQTIQLSVKIRIKLLHAISTNVNLAKEKHHLHQKWR
uniref:Uncharacterized protein n=1 Tax=Anguilla anguilla TaxID=7936 RepID=A0A0E9VYR7_ANGAN